MCTTAWWKGLPKRIACTWTTGAREKTLASKPTGSKTRLFRISPHETVLSVHFRRISFPGWELSYSIFDGVLSLLCVILWIRHRGLDLPASVLYMLVFGLLGVSFSCVEEFSRKPAAS